MCPPYQQLSFITSRAKYTQNCPQVSGGTKHCGRVPHYKREDTPHSKHGRYWSLLDELTHHWAEIEDEEELYPKAFELARLSCCNTCRCNSKAMRKFANNIIAHLHQIDEQELAPAPTCNHCHRQHPEDDTTSSKIRRLIQKIKQMRADRDSWKKGERDAHAEVQRLREENEDLKRELEASRQDAKRYRSFCGMFQTLIKTLDSRSEQKINGKKTQGAAQEELVEEALDRQFEVMNLESADAE